jgi:hypothetical protein
MSRRTPENAYELSNAGLKKIWCDGGFKTDLRFFVRGTPHLRRGREQDP